MGPRSDEFRQMLAEEYLNSTISIKELNKKYHTDATYQLKKYGISLKGKGVQRMITRADCIKYNWDAKEVVNEEQAYTLGFFMADGYNSGMQAGINLKTSDSYILERMKNCFSNEIKTQHYKNYDSFVISSMVICNNLRKLGIVKQKSVVGKRMPKLKPELIRHFIRGYFDGDGTVFVCKSRKNNFLKCNICSSTQGILKQIQDVLSNEDIVSAINVEKRIGKEYRINGKRVSIATMDMFRLFIRRKSSIEKFFHYLYDDATIYLERKYRLFAENQEMFVYKHVNTELTK